MPIYTALCSINISAEIEAADEDEAMEKLRTMNVTDFIGDSSIEDYDFMLDYLIDEHGYEYYRCL